MKKTDPNLSYSPEAEGKELYADKKYLQAAEAFSQAAIFYSSHSQDLQAAEMKNNQCVALLKANKPEQALEAVEGTAEIFISGGNALNQAMAYANEATALKELGETQAAIDKFTRAASIFDQLNATEMHSQTMQSISGLKLKSRNIPGAIFSMQEGLIKIEKPSLIQKILIKLLKIPQNMIDN